MHNMQQLDLTPLETHETSWQPSHARLTLNVTLDAMIVPSASGAARVDTAHLVVLDDFIGEEERRELLDFITEPGWDHARGPPPSKWERATRDRTDAAPTWGLKDGCLRALASAPLRAKREVHSRMAALYPHYTIAHMPSDLIQQQQQGQEWEEGEGEEEAHGEGEGGMGQQGGGCHGLQGQQEERSPDGEGPSETGQAAGSCEGGSRMGGEGIGEGGCTADIREVEGGGAGQREAGPLDSGGRSGDVPGEGDGASVDISQVGDTGAGEAADMEEDDTPGGLQSAGTSVDCNQFVANAATHGDSYSWHVDADPSTLPFPSPWTRAYGQYVNREPGRPLFVSLLLYLNPSWERQWDAETLFLDTPSDCGVVVRPKACRAVLFDQDVLHRLSMPALAAGSLPRYSLVWKLVLVPTRAGQQVTLARPEWGRPTAFGSAAVLERVVRGMAAAGHKAGPGGSGGKGEQSGEQVGAEAGAAMGDGAAGAAGGQGGKEEQVEDEREGCGAREAKRVRREDGRGAGG